MAAGAGSITFTGIVGGTTALSSLSATGSAITTTSVRTNGGVITLTGPVTVTGTSTLDTTNTGGTATGATISFSSTVNGAVPLTLRAGTVGNISLGGAVGNITPLTNLIFTSSALIQVGANVTVSGANPLTFGQAVSLTGGSTITTNGANVGFSSTINGGNALSVAAGAGSITFTGIVGGTTPLSSLQATSSGVINISFDQSVSSGPMTYSGAVVLGGNVQFTDSGGSGIEFDTVSGNHNLSLVANSSTITINGNINLAGSSGSVGGNFTATSSGTGAYGGQILVQGGGNGGGAGGNGGTVSITSTSGSVLVQLINVTGGNGTTGGNGGGITLQPTNTYSGNYPNGLIVLNAALTSSAGTGGGGVGGTITLSASRTSSAAVATITSSLGGNDIAITAAEIVMGTSEVMTALGNIDLTAPTMTLGDLVALDNLTIMGSTINLLVHGDESILANNGLLYTSPSLHFMAGGTYLQVGTLVPSGPLNAQSLGLSPSEFGPQLLFGSHILNFDTAPKPVPPTPTQSSVSASSKEYAIYLLNVAGAQLSDMLPRFSYPLSYPL